MDIFKVFHLPREIQEGERISIYGQVADETGEYSINFANSRDQNPPDISYQFKCNLIEKRIQQNIKENDVWRYENEFENDVIDGPDIKLEFIFNSDSVDVYVAENHNYITNFELENDLSDMKSLQVGGMKHISKLIFDFK